MNEAIIGGIAIGGLIGLFGVFIGIIIEGGMMRDKLDAMEQTAVKRGYAVWKTDDKGNVTFEWKE